MNPKLYHYIAQGMCTIDNVDDAEEMRLTDEAFDILNFSAVWILVFIYISETCGRRFFLLFSKL